MNLKDKMRRYLFPTYDETMETLQHGQTLGAERLKERGFAIGDTVYLDGKLKGTIEDAIADPYGLIVDARVQLKTDGKEAAAFFGLQDYASYQYVNIPCSLDDIEKEPRDYESWTEENFRQAIQNTSDVQQKMRLLDKMRSRKFEETQ